MTAALVIVARVTVDAMADVTVAGAATSRLPQPWSPSRATSLSRMIWMRMKTMWRGRMSRTSTALTMYSRSGLGSQGLHRAMRRRQAPGEIGGRVRVVVVGAADRVRAAAVTPVAPLVAAVRRRRLLQVNRERVTLRRGPFCCGRESR